MRRARTLITAGAVAAATLGAGATSASAWYSISGGSYTGTATSDIRFDFARGYQIDCQDVTISGYATGSSSTDFTPTFSNCDFFGLPATVTQSGTWSSNVVAGPTGGGWYYADFYIPTGTTTTVDIPLIGCTAAITGPQWSIAPINYRSTMWGAEMDFHISLMTYSATNCPFSDGTDASVSTTWGRIEIPGIVIS